MALFFLVATAMTNCRQTYPELKHHCCIVLLHIYICIWPVFSACDVHGRTLHLRPGILKVSFLSAKKKRKKQKLRVPSREIVVEFN